MAKRKRSPKPVRVVTLSDLGGACDCVEKPRRAVGGNGKLSLRELRGLGKFCVMNRKTSEVVRCYRQRKAAETVARGFGPGFRVDAE
jgi:hypothetical protein